jgi:uncharacterized membrane protein YesL
MSNKTQINIGGSFFTGALAFLFITLKLLGKISWSWLWVLSPLWIPIATALAILAVIAVFLLVVAWSENRRES